MTTAVQRRRGTTTEHATFTGLEGEISVNTTKDTLVVHDGATVGGFEIARADGSNFVASTVDINGGTIDGASIGASSASTGAFTTLSASGEITAGAGIALPDNGKATFGDSDDLQIYHDGSNSFIADVGTGNLGIRAENLFLQNADGSANYATASLNGAFTLSYNNSQKLATTNTGIDVTGSVVADGLTVDGSATIFVASSGATANTNADDLVINSNTNAGISILGDGNETQYLMFGDAANSAAGRVAYSHVDDSLQLFAAGLERVRITSAGNVGIGTSSPEARIHASGGENSVHAVFGTRATRGLEIGTMIGGDGATDNTAFYNMKFSSNGSHVWQAGGVERMRIDSVGNVGIGTSSPTSYAAFGYGPSVEISGGNGGSLIVSDTGQTNKTVLTHYSNSGEGILKTTTNKSLHFATNDSGPRMTIDTAGNLLLGKTSSSFSVAGIGLMANDQIFATATSDNSLALNRLTSDGDIAKFYKDGTTVGSIGVVNANNLTIGGDVAGHAGMEFGTQQIAPRSGGTSVDATVDLGYFSLRWKDLYLSGGVYLGGTGAANKLDDYEEGTFSGTATGSTYNGTYTKVGRICHISMDIDNSSSTGTQLASLPFSAKNGGTAFNGSQPTFNTSASTPGFYVALYNGGTALFGYSVTGSTQNLNSGNISVNFVYETD